MEKLKNSIHIRLFLTVSLLIIFVIFFVICLNNTILEKYYILKKETALIEIYNNINGLIKNAEEQITIESDLEKTDANRNFEIVIRDKYNKTIYITSRDFVKNKILLEINKNKTPLDFDNPPFIFKENDTYKIITFVDVYMGTQFLGLIGKLDNDYSLYIRTPIQSVKESIQISNSFFMISGLIGIFITSIITLIVSKSFTKPIKELNNIAQDMANLKFDKKYTIRSKDEIGMLGQSINTLSTNLEKTILDLKEANIDLEKDIENKSKLNEMRSQFISDVSHELKTPIALIQGYAEGLVDSIVTSPEDQKYYCEVILDEANKMAELTRGLLDLSKLEYGADELNIEQFNISLLISNILKKMEVIFNENNINVEFNEKDEILVNGDIFRIEQIITNYLNNAIKNLDDKKIIKISITENENFVRVNVYNSGNHISDENMQRIWTRFYKVDTSRNRENGGTGLGLSLVKAIILRHGTDCGAENLDGGVNFWFELNNSIYSL